jgi:hypothetical protein
MKLNSNGLYDECPHLVKWNWKFEEYKIVLRMWLLFLEHLNLPVLILS